MMNLCKALILANPSSVNLSSKWREKYAYISPKVALVTFEILRILYWGETGPYLA